MQALLLCCRVLRAAAAVLDLLPGGHAGSPAQTGSGSVAELARVERAGSGGVRRRFRELSVAVHPDKCALPGAQKARALQLLASFLLS
jgi:hypothetical protein